MGIMGTNKLQHDIHAIMLLVAIFGEDGVLPQELSELKKWKRSPLGKAYYDKFNQRMLSTMIDTVNETITHSPTVRPPCV